ncbi:acyltransferase [Actinomadura craniellae]|uniref:Acyltransferase n=1 Tax=Actinomadura craniellae TaxID=2231787 RepID=A0A365H308_9ACTN|nr:acyltransferase [Actinomadura craniellae]RAY13490.1 acyltransferase [Actinomadura craniellae]
MAQANRLRELDLLRFLAALGVLLFHFTGFAGKGPWPESAAETFPGMDQVTRYGYLGVDLFFMISGFVILMSAWGRGLGSFGVSRVVRLMPAYWVAVLFGVFVYQVFGLGQGTVARMIPNLTMLQAGVGVGNIDSVFWTLWVELHFYMLIAGLVAIGLTYRTCVIFMASWMFLGLFANEADNKLLQVMLIPTWNMYFIAGMALYLIYRAGPSLLLWGFVAVTWLLSLHWGAWRVEASPAWSRGEEPVVAAVITVLFIVMILVATGRLSWLRWRGLTVLGALTYPLYLTHAQLALPLLDAVYPGLNRWAALAVLTAASLLLAYAIYRLVEVPGTAWMRPRLLASLDRLRADPLPTVPPPRREPVPAEPEPARAAAP